MKNKILLTGGHAGTTALSVIEELEHDSNLKLYWIGSSIAVEGKKTKTLESKLLPEKKVEYFEISAGRLQKRFTRHTLLSLVKVPLGFVQSFFLLLKINPDVVLSFGGFVSVPVVFSAWLLGKTIIVHEQTIACGLANKITSIFANKIAISRVESEKYFNKSKTILTGNPINKAFLQIKRKALNNLIYITGGSRGSQIINEVVFESLPELLKKYQIIHQTGELDFPKSKSINNHNYSSFDFLTPKQVSDIYSKASLVISRSGANTVSELSLLKIPTIYIPIPWTRYDEQTKNAQLAEKTGLAKILKQDLLTPESLINAIENSFKNKIKINQEIYDRISIDAQASKNISDLIISYLK